jgi:hypothetical protein
MATKATTPEDIAARLDAAEAEARRHRDALAAIRDAEDAARHSATVEYYTDAAGPHATRVREERDAAKEQLDKLAYAEQVDLNTLFNAFLAFKASDAKCGAVRNHAANINVIDPLPRNRAGAEVSHVIHCSELYSRLTFSDYLADVVAKRTARAGAEHGQELHAAAAAKVTAAVEQARAAAAGT